MQRFKFVSNVNERHPKTCLQLTVRLPSKFTHTYIAYGRINVNWKENAECNFWLTSRKQQNPEWCKQNMHIMYELSYTVDIYILITTAALLWTYVRNFKLATRNVLVQKRRRLVAELNTILKIKLLYYFPDFVKIFTFFKELHFFLIRCIVIYIGCGKAFQYHNLWRQYRSNLMIFHY